MNKREKQIEELCKLRDWGKEAAELGFRSHFRCEYCGKDLLESVETYKEWQIDHIIPLCCGGKDSIENKAVCCRTCNINFKSRWNPQEKINKKASRQELIKETRKYVRQKRKENEEHLKSVRKILGI